MTCAPRLPHLTGSSAVPIAHPWTRMESHGSLETGMTASEGAPAPREIWHARFNFDDLGYKFRPALILACSQDGVLATMITSAANKLSLPLNTPLEDWHAAGLTKASLVRVDRIALLPPTYLGTFYDPTLSPWGGAWQRGQPCQPPRPDTPHQGLHGGRSHGTPPKDNAQSNERYAPGTNPHPTPP